MTVEEAADQTCDTGTAKGLSDQIIEKLLAQNPGVLVKVTDSRIYCEPRVNMILQSSAANSLYAALSAGGRSMEIISAYRTVAQQVMLYTWYRRGECGITLASQPGDSNHEDGAALDIGDTDYWRPYLTGRGWNWQGSNDPSHYSYRGSGFDGGVGARGLVAFQSVWNEHNPGDLLEVDGSYGPATEAALLASPVEGWPMQPIRIRINDTPQTGTVGAWLADGNSVMDISDWCAYSKTPPARFDNSAKDDEYAGEVSIWTYKTACQVMDLDGVACGRPALVAADVPVLGVEGTVREALCAEHFDALQTARSGIVGAKPSEKKHRKKKG